MNEKPFLYNHGNSRLFEGKIYLFVEDSSDRERLTHKAKDLKAKGEFAQISFSKPNRIYTLWQRDRNESK